MTTPLVSGFTFIKNGLTLGYPILESVKSIEPLCDEVVINVGFDDINCEKDDGTYQYLRDSLTHEKYVFLKSYWDPKLTQKGLILSQQTNLALEKCRGKFAQYIQGDEVIHENDLSKIHEGYIDMDRNDRIQGLVFNYIHFYGNIDAYLYTRRIYRREVRAIRNKIGVKSFLDAQGFKTKNDEKLHCKHIDARIFHYGWARKEKVMEKKITAMDKLYHGSDYEKDESFEYRRIWGLRKYLADHPEVMQEWIKNNKNELDIHKLKRVFSRGDISLAISDFIEKMTGLRLGEYKNYKLIK